MDKGGHGLGGGVNMTSSTLVKRQPPAAKWSMTSAVWQEVPVIKTGAGWRVTGTVLA